MNALFQMFPSTIHPMVIHFTIAIIYLAGLVGVAGLFRKGDPFFSRAFLWLGILSILATLAAGVAGVISGYYVTVSGGVANMLEMHKNYGELTGILLLGAFAFQVLAYRKRKAVSVAGVAITLLAVVLVSVTGHLGGQMVYDHGLGVQLAHH